MLRGTTHTLLGSWLRSALDSTYHNLSQPSPSFPWLYAKLLKHRDAESIIQRAILSIYFRKSMFSAVCTFVLLVRGYALTKPCKHWMSSSLREMMSECKLTHIELPPSCLWRETFSACRGGTCGCRRQACRLHRIKASRGAVAKPATWRSGNTGSNLLKN